MYLCLVCLVWSEEDGKWLYCTIKMFISCILYNISIVKKSVLHNIMFVKEWFLLVCLIQLIKMIMDVC